MIATMPKCEITLRHGSYPVHFCCIFSEHLFVGTTLDGCFRSNKPRKYSAAAQTYSENNARIFYYSAKNNLYRSSGSMVYTRRCFNIYKTSSRRLTCVSGGKNCSFFGKFGVLCLLETPVLRFVLLPYYRRFVKSSLLDL